ncbi:hypothetical protein LH709_001086 [Vibrio vulnificus]|nr:hypothetical protein [Vibrio vulnificus]EIJ0940891.1 hypothetical protein [Vibrio vulnificus]EKO5169392.1 hypothetical protein [Vibrio vulnificus]ELX4207012.1 hypothetical protein [Vibrio vulnificus]
MNKKLFKTTMELCVLQMYQMQLTVVLAAYVDMSEGTLDNLNFLLKNFSDKEQKDDRSNIIKWLSKHTDINYSTKKKKLYRSEAQKKWKLLAGLHDELFLSASSADECCKKFNLLSLDDLFRVIDEVKSEIEKLEKRRESLGRDDPLYNQIKNTFDSNATSIKGFKWPSTLAYESSENIPEVDWPQVGMLKGVGYSVGAKGLPTAQRRELLSNIMSQQLPYVTSYAYRQEWGEPNTTARLKKLANTIANLAKNSKRSSNNTSIAISEWEEDLRWLKENYYKNGKYSWSWPS